MEVSDYARASGRRGRQICSSTCPWWALVVESHDGADAELGPRPPLMGRIEESLFVGRLKLQERNTGLLVEPSGC